ncbi:S8 family serine peptidase [Aquimarina sp. 2201CG1-2-11]|uniref:S8 family serine peptidase n=1 Tax=Aquimarina discodermiae TaxID=3231043 RepID=UPI0034627B42
MKKIQLLTTLLMISITLLSFSNGYSQNKVNKKGQFTRVFHVKFNSDQVNKIERELNRNGVKVAGKSEYLRAPLKDIDIRNKTFKARSIKRLFRHAGKHEARHRAYGLHLWYEIEYDGGQEVDQVVKAYKEATSVEIAEPVYEIQFADSTNEPQSTIPVLIDSKYTDNNRNLIGTPNDPRYRDQWHYNNTGQSPDAISGNDINLEKAWEIETGDKSVIVAIEDTGFDVNHPDLKGNLWVNEGEIPGNGIDDDNNGYVDDVHGYNFADDTGTISAGSHGTHVAGTVAAETNNGVGVAGVAGGSGSDDGVRLMATSIFGLDIKGAAEAFIYAADNGAVISQNSWGYGVITATIKEADKAAIDYFIANAGGNNSPMNGGIVIFAAGNNGIEGNFFPGRYEPILSVASLANSGKKASYSNYGTWIDVAAPGGDQNTSGTTAGVLSTIPGGYGYQQGTSMACPHVSGVAALVASRYKGKLSATELKQIIETNTDPVDNINMSYAGKLGSGRINALKALQAGDASVAIPKGLSVSTIGATSVQLNWNKVNNALRYTIRYKTTNGNWIEQNTSNTTIKLEGLQKSSNYEIQLRAESLTKMSSYTSSVSFTTLDLEVPRAINVSSITDSSAIVNWSPTAGATQYMLRYKETTATNWTNASVTTNNSITLSNLVFNSFYEVQVQAINNTTSSIFSESVSFLTKDNGSGGCNGIDAWDSTKVYNDAGTKVAYQGVVYQNKWWTQGNIPGTTSHWEQIDTCSDSGNVPPSVQITEPNNNQIFEQETLTAIRLSANATDSDGTISKIQFEVDGTLLPSGNNRNWTPTEFKIYTIKVTATDDKGDIATDEVRITVKRKEDTTNQNPVVSILNIIDGQVIEQEMLAAIQLSADAKDPDGTIEKIQFEVNGTALTSGNNVNWLPTAFGVYTVKVTVTDNKEATATAQVGITVRQTSSNQPPSVSILNIINGQEIEQETLTAITLSANASDPDGTISSIQFEVNGSALSSGNNKSWFPVAFDTYTIKVTVTDNQGAVATQQITISIKEKTSGGDCNGVSAWNPSTIYPSTGGVQVSYNGNIYHNKWWTQNNEPGTGGSWGPWELIGTCSSGIKNAKIEGNERVISVFPNPAVNFVDILIHMTSTSPVKVELYTITGQYCTSLTANKIDARNYHVRCDLTNFSNGIYFIKMKSKEKERTAKIMIRK